MRNLTEQFLLSPSDLKNIQQFFQLSDFNFEFKCQDIGEGIELNFNEENFSIQNQKLFEKLEFLNGLIEEDDYISIAIISRSEVVYKHENKRKNYGIDSFLEILQNPSKFPNYKEVETIPWWENDK